jgi:hypothetical protein
MDKVVVRTNEEELIISQRKTIQELRDELDDKVKIIEVLKSELSVFKVNV